MPHITIEYSANVGLHHDVAALVGAVHAAADQHGLAPSDGLRTRAARRDHFRVADGHRNHAFIAIMVRIGPGRDAEAKSRFLETVLCAAESAIAAEGGPLAVAWSAELTEIDDRFRINRNEVRARIAAGAGAGADAIPNAVPDAGTDAGAGAVPDKGADPGVRADALEGVRGQC